MKKPTIQVVIGFAMLAILNACANSGSSEHPNNMPSGANGTTHGQMKSGMKSNPESNMH